MQQKGRRGRIGDCLQNLPSPARVAIFFYSFFSQSYYGSFFLHPKSGRAEKSWRPGLELERTEYYYTYPVAARLFAPRFFFFFEIMFSTWNILDRRRS